MMSVAPMFLCCSPLVIAADAQTSISTALHTLESVRAISEVAISPDGRHVVYGSVMTGTRNGAEVDVTALFLADAHDGSHVQRLTACPQTACNEHTVAWSPDGTRIAYVTTDATEQPQLAVAAADGSGVHVITHAHGPLDTPRWSPDGKRIAFLYSAGAPKTPGPLNPLSRDAGVLTSTVYEQRLAIVADTGGEPTLIGPADLNIYEYDWSPDGRRFVVSAAHGSGDDNWWIAELDLLDAQSGAPTTLAKPALQIASPRWSADGSRIAYIAGIMSDEAITGGDVYVISAAGGAPVNATPSLKASVNTVTFNGSARRLIATEFAAGEEVLAVIDVDTKTQRELWRGPQMIWANTLLGFAPGDSGISLSKNGAFSAVIRQSYTSPPEVETGPPGKWKTRTSGTPDLSPARTTNRATESGIMK